MWSIPKLEKKTYICIPAYNEEPTIGEVLYGIMDLYSKDPLIHVAVIDNGSTDGTADIVRALYNMYTGKISLNQVPHGCGITAVYAKAFNYAVANGAEYVIGMDAGLSHDPKHIPQFVRLLSEYDCVFGSRKLGAYKAPIDRKIVSKAGNLLSNVLLGLRSTDATSGFAGFRKEVISQIPFDSFQSRWYFYDTELKYYCREAGFKCAETPIDYIATSSSFKYSHIKEALRSLAYLSLRRLERGLKKPPDDKIKFMFP